MDRYLNRAIGIPVRSIDEEEEDCNGAAYDNDDVDSGYHHLNRNGSKQTSSQSSSHVGLLATANGIDDGHDDEESVIGLSINTSRL